MKSPFTTEALRSPIVTLALCALPLAGCQGLAWANLAALAVTVALFLGTLQLRRPTRTPSVTGAATTSQLGGQVAAATVTKGQPALSSSAAPIARG